MHIFILIFCLFLEFVCPYDVFAAFQSRASFESENIKGQRVPDDIILPMPFRGEMILRPVAVPSGALLRDKAFSMGISNADDQERQIFERQFPGHIAAPFTLDDLPEEWVNKVKISSGKGRNSWYFIGKYEVTRGQWFQVMDGLTPDGDKKDDYLTEVIPNPDWPISNINWYQVQEFFHKYNNWLIKNYKDRLPVFKGTRNIGYLRLPTEEEWEYAARGGAKVPPEWWEDQDFYPMEAGKGFESYAVFAKPRLLEKAIAGGYRQANPLGLYDTSGNVREMVHGFFHMSIPEIRDDKLERRLHGAAGGIIAKGGGFRSFEEGILPGAREEIPLYSVDGAVGARDLGFRVALAGVNFPGGERLAELKRESRYSPENKGKASSFEDNMDVRQMVAALAADANGELKDKLEKLRARIEDQANAEKARELKNLEYTYRSLLYQAETLRAFAFRYWAASREIDKIKKLLDHKLDPVSQKQAEELLAQAEKDINDYLQSLEMGARYYKASLGVIYAESADELDRLAKQAMGEYGGLGIFNQHMRQNIEILEKNLATVRQKGLKALQPNAILKGILPEKHYKLLPADVKRG